MNRVPKKTKETTGPVLLADIISGTRGEKEKARAKEEKNRKRAEREAEREREKETRFARKSEKNKERALNKEVQVGYALSSNALFCFIIRFCPRTHRKLTV